MSKNNRFGFITIMGYFWFSTTALWTILEIYDASFGLFDILGSWSWCILVGIFVISIVTALLLYRLFPSILEGLFRRKQEREKYVSTLQARKQKK